VILFGWTWVDPTATLLIAGYILWQSLREMPAVMRILMLASPPDLDTAAVIDTVQSTPGVASTHHVHLWMMGEHETALDAHVVLDPGAPADATRSAVKARLAAAHHLHHSTLEMETRDHACRAPLLIGH
jgi:cobalt-zinc-cadmium efflux system protein